MEEIDLFLTPDDSVPSGIESDDYDSKGDILFLEELLSNDSPLLHENKSFHFDVPSSPRPLAKPPDDDEIKPDTGVLTTKVVGDISEQCVLMSILLPTQPTLASNEEKSPHLLSHRGFKAFQLKYGRSSHAQDSVNKNKRFDCPDCEASRAHGFVIQSLELQSFA
ncbi:hypothetical protein Tco_1554927 [Tanacetum coccineum]